MQLKYYTRLFKSNSVFKFSLFFGLLFLSESVLSNTLRIHGGIWGGIFHSEMDERVKLDYLIEGNTYRSRLLLPAESQVSRTVHPLGLEYSKKLGPGNLILTANFHHIALLYRYDGYIVYNPGISSLHLSSYNQYQFDAGAGYSIGIYKKLVYITPELLFRTQYTGFQFNELTYGFYESRTQKSSFHARGTNFHTGIKAEVVLYKNLSFVTGWSGPLPYYRSKGFMRMENLLFIADTTVFYYTNPVYQQERASSKYSYSLDHRFAGLRLKIFKNIILEAGMRSEKQKVSYPDYSGMPVEVSAGIVSPVNNFMNEYISDYILWGMKTEEKKGMYYLSAAYDYHWK